MTNYREILRLHSLGLNHSQISVSTGTARQTVITALQKAAVKGLDWNAAEIMNDKDISSILSGSADNKPIYMKPDYTYIHNEMQKPGVTLQLLWMEYSEKCRTAGEIPYQLTQFKKYYREHVVTNKATMHISRNPGELMEVDWAGQTAAITDVDTGDKIDAYIFVASLPYSGYSYVEAFLSQNQEAWCAAHVNAYKYFSGVTRILVPDNLKTGIIKHTKSEVIVNRSYQELAEHYGTAIIPARVKTPKDKATVEGTVGIISTWILAAIRNEQFFSLYDLNEVIHERLHIFNHKPFQKKDGSRASQFAEERLSLMPLPPTPYELAIWKQATVSFNYHIAVEENFYSVPFEYIKRVVDVRLTMRTVEVFYEGSRICSHVRRHGKRNWYTTDKNHMPPDHRHYMEWDGDRFRNWASEIGNSAVKVISAILSTHKIEQQGYRSCMALVKLADKYPSDHVEAACLRALNYSNQPTYKIVQAILKNGQDIEQGNTNVVPDHTQYGFVRGAEYYGKGLE
jgi:transposase